ncbi:MAG: chemotaxis protein CheC [Acidobacteriota bacterium]
MLSEIEPQDLDALREVSNIGAGHAVTALHQMTHRIITLEVPHVRLVPFSRVVEALGGPEEEVVGLFFRIFGGSRGNMLVVMPRQAADRLLSALFNGQRATKPFGDMEISALKEVGNILTSSYLNAIGSLLSIPLIPSIPAFSLDMAQAVVDLLLIELAEVTSKALVIQTEFSTRDRSFAGHFFLLPDPVSIETILAAIRKMRGRG